MISACMSLTKMRTLNIDHEGYVFKENDESSVLCGREYF